MNRKTVSGITLTLLLVSVLTLELNVQPVKAEPKTWTVDDDGPAGFHTIQEAINAANPGDTIYVYNGTYYEYIRISKSLSLIGENKYATIIDGSGYGPVVIISASRTNFTSFTVRNAGWTNWERDNGIRLYRTQLSQVTDCIVSGGAYGIREIREWGVGGENVINGNTVSDATEIAIGSSHQSSIGNIVANNTITNSTNGIYFNNPYDMQILGNHIFGTESQHSQYGIHLQVGGLNNTIIGNRIEYSDNAIRLDYADSNVVEENAVENCTFGVFVGYESSDNIVVGNNASGSSIGFMLWDKSNDNLVTNNLATNNDYGIALSSSNSNKIYHNNFISNDQQVLNIDGQPNVWDDGYPSGGNYWSDYAGVDLYSGPYQNVLGGDGIGDNPYVIDADNQDNYPLIKPWSPPAVVLRIPEALFDPADTTHFNVTIQNSQKSITHVDITRIIVNLENRSFLEITETIPMLPYTLHPNAVVTFTCGWDWSDYRRKTVAVTVYTQQGYLAGKTTLTPPVEYTLTIYSSPTGVTFTVDDISHTTPWLETYEEGTSVSLEMPETHDVGEARYWSRWSDGVTNRSRTVTMNTNITLTGLFIPLEPAIIDVTPDTMNLVGKGKWIIVYIELPEGYNVSDIDVSSILLNGTVSAELEPITIGDYDNNTIPDLMVLFNRTLIVEYILSEGITYGNVTLILTGQLHHVKPHSIVVFEGSDIIKVSDLLSDLNCDGEVDLFDAVLLAAAYGSTPEDPNWNPDADLAPQYGIINLYDAVTMAYHYGQTYP